MYFYFILKNDITFFVVHKSKFCQTLLSLSEKIQTQQINHSLPLTRKVVDEINSQNLNREK